MKKEAFNLVRTNGQFPDPAQVDSSMIIEDLWPAYIDSTTSQLTALEAAALAFEAGKNSKEDAARIRRILHSIKGESGMCGVMDVYTLCHEAEFGFEELDHSAAADMVLRVKDWIDAVVRHLQGEDTSEFIHYQAPVQQLDLSAQKRLKALVIDDDPVCRKGLELLLADFCECTFAEDGKEGFQKFLEALDERKPYDVVTLDIQMPKMDGHETLEAIRKTESELGIEGLDGVKIIMTTSQEEPGHVFGAFREGCEAYVIKPAAGKLYDEMVKLGLLDASKVYVVKK